jgi:chromate transporter
MVPTIVLMIILLTALNTFKDQPWVGGMTKAVVPVVAVMLATLTWDFVKKSTKSSLGWGWTLLFVAASLILLEFVNIHPAIIIFALLLTALLKKDAADKSEAKKEKNPA